MKRILVVDDDRDLRSSLVEILSGEGYECGTASSCPEALAEAAAAAWDVVLLDMMLPGGDGAACLQELRRINPSARVVVITAFSTIRNAVDLMRKGASDYLAKPFKIEELTVAVKRALQEADFEKRTETGKVHTVLGALASPVRTAIVRLLRVRSRARLSEIARDLDTEDRAKILFHLKKLEQTGIVEHDRDSRYSLTIFGDMARECLDIMEMRLSGAAS